MTEEFTVRPGDVRAYGIHAAYLLGVVRSRCDHGWWRVTHDGIAAETGLSIKQARTTTEKLFCLGAIERTREPSCGQDARTYSYRPAVGAL